MTILDETAVEFKRSNTRRAAKFLDCSYFSARVSRVTAVSPGVLLPRPSSTPLLKVACQC